METWKPVVGFENLYEISNTGAVRSIVRVVEVSRPSGVYSCRKSSKVRSVSYNRCGYLKVTLYKGTRLVTRLVHRLVCEAFNGPPPSDKHTVNHKNGVKDDNRPENLEWATRGENIAHAIKHLGQTRIGVINGYAKLTEDDVREIRRRRARGETLPVIALAIGVSEGCVASAARGRSWSHVK